MFEPAKKDSTVHTLIEQEGLRIGGATSADSKFRCGFCVEDEFSNPLYLEFTGDKILVAKLRPSFGTLPFLTRFVLRKILRGLFEEAVNAIDAGLSPNSNSYEIDLRRTVSFDVNQRLLGSKELLIVSENATCRFRLKKLRKSDRASIARWLVLRRLQGDPIPGNSINEKVESTLARFVATGTERGFIRDMSTNLIANMIWFFIGLALASVLH